MLIVLWISLLINVHTKIPILIIDIFLAKQFIYEAAHLTSDNLYGILVA